MKRKHYSNFSNDSTVTNSYRWKVTILNSPKDVVTSENDLVDLSKSEHWKMDNSSAPISKHKCANDSILSNFSATSIMNTNTSSNTVGLIHNFNEIKPCTSLTKSHHQPNFKDKSIFIKSDLKREETSGRKNCTTPIVPNNDIEKIDKVGPRSKNKYEKALSFISEYFQTNAIPHTGDHSKSTAEDKITSADAGNTTIKCISTQNEQPKTSDLNSKDPASKILVKPNKKIFEPISKLGISINRESINSASSTTIKTKFASTAPLISSSDSHHDIKVTVIWYRKSVIFIFFYVCTTII